MLLNQIRALLYGINLDMQSTAARSIPKYAIQIQKWEIVYLYLRVVLLGPWSSFNDPQAAWANSGSIITFPGRNKGKRGQGTWLRESEEHSLLSNSPPGIQTTSLLTGNKLHSPSDMRKSEKGISFSFFFCCMACAILVPWPGVKPLQRKCSLNHGTTRKVLRNAFKNIPQGLAWGSHG